MRFLVPLITLLLGLTASADQYQKPYGQIQEEKSFKDYTVRIYRYLEPPPDNDTNPDHQDGNGCFEILRSGKQVYFKKGFKFGLGDIFDDENTNHYPHIGQSITPDHQPNLVVSEWSGGAHCCFTYYIYQIGAQFKYLGSVEGENTGVDFKDVNRNGDLRLVIYDWTFEYWHAGFANSPSAQVVLRYQNGKYKPDLEMMKKQAPTKIALKAKAKAISDAFGEGSIIDQDFSAPPELWGEMLDLIYSGNMASAWKLCDWSWPAKHPGKTVFLKEFKEKLATSPYYQDILKLNRQTESGHKS